MSFKLQAAMVKQRRRAGPLCVLPVPGRLGQARPRRRGPAAAANVGRGSQLSRDSWRVFLTISRKMSLSPPIYLFLSVVLSCIVWTSCFTALSVNLPQTRRFCNWIPNESRISSNLQSKTFASPLMSLSGEAPKNGVANKVALVALGCPKNTVDAEVMLGDLQKRGFSIVRQPKDADVGKHYD